MAAKGGRLASQAVGEAQGDGGSQETSQLSEGDALKVTCLST